MLLCFHLFGGVRRVGGASGTGQGCFGGMVEVASMQSPDRSVFPAGCAAALLPESPRLASAPAARSDLAPVLCGVAAALLPESPRLASAPAARSDFAPVLCGVAVALLPESPRLASAPAVRSDLAPVLCGVAAALLPESPRLVAPPLRQPPQGDSAPVCRKVQ